MVRGRRRGKKPLMIAPRSSGTKVTTSPSRSLGAPLMPPHAIPTLRRSSKPAPIPKRRPARCGPGLQSALSAAEQREDDDLVAPLGEDGKFLVAGEAFRQIEQLSGSVHVGSFNRKDQISRP